MTERRKFLGQPTRAEASKFVGLERELTVDQQSGSLRVHDGRTPGGSELATTSLANVDETILVAKLTSKEDVANKTQSINNLSSNLQYPSAKAVYDQLVLKQDKANLETSLSTSTTKYPCSNAVKVVTDTLANRDLSNITETAKLKILDSNKLDWSKATTINSPYRPTTYGYAIFFATSISTDRYVNINGYEIARTYGSPGHYGNNITVQIPVGPSDVLSFNANTRLFVPYKEV